ncbi:MAG: hypothetical protein E6I88_13000 [Chloroflexi bacterium]|nr:MAG: hypothetical protein E6I88_13000 [Chloroflexota bacterium]
MKLFAKGKADAAPKAPAFNPIDRANLLGLLDQVVNTGQSGVLELHEPRGNWIYAFQAGALTHASGGRVRGARQAFDLLWEFQAGEFTFTPGVNPSLAGNLYIDKNRLLDLLRRSQAVLQGPSAPYIPPDQQRPIAPVQRPYTPPSPSQLPPAWQPGMQQQQPQAWPPAGQPGMPQGQPGMPPPQGWPNGYPQQMGPPQQPYPGAPGQQPYPGAPGQQPYPGQFPPAGQPQPPQGYPPVRGNVRPQGMPQTPVYPNYPAQAPTQPPAMHQQSMPQQPMAPQAMPYPAPAQPMQPQPMSPQAAPFAAQRPAAPARPPTPPTFNVPPMAIPRKTQPAPMYQPPATAPVPAPEPAKPAQDDLAALRASLVAQAPAAKAVPSPGWAVRTADGSIAPPATADPKGKGKPKGKDKAKAKEKGKSKGDSKLMTSIKVQLIKFLLWACERRYSPDDHWTLKDAFEVSTMELREQFFGAFSQTFAATKKKQQDDDEDDMAAGRMRGRGRRH